MIGLRMYLSATFTYTFVVIQMKTQLGNGVCDKPWKNGLNLNGSLEDSLNSIRAVLNGFLIAKILGSEKLSAEFEQCAREADCRLHAILGKKRVDSMILCVSINSSTYCHDATCACKGRVKRGIDTPVDEAKMSKDKEVQNLEKPTCEITNGQENYCPKTNSQEFPKKKTDLGNGTMNITQVTNLTGDFRKESCLRDKGNWIYVVTALIGIFIGILIGVLITLLYIKRGGARSINTISVLNSIYFKKKETSSSDELEGHGDMEYSEIQELPSHFEEQSMPIVSEACTGNKDSIQSSVMPKHEYCGQEGAVDKY
uniref:Uncharacterized protein LOC111106160 n=1 Tax=Crassostrea virginica TaxID=6565 RepID=A0A8B8AZ77_CRAVI|nr:uncharacterized protein LOC111106160 [Crassostrea virginica]